MELPEKLTTELKIIQHQMMLAIRTHQIMRRKLANDPDKFKPEDLQEVERRISRLGHKQNQLMNWVRKQITTMPCNSALIAKTIASSLGISVNGSHPSSASMPSNVSLNKSVTLPKMCKASNLKELVHGSGMKTIAENHASVKKMDELSIAGDRKVLERMPKTLWKRSLEPDGYDLIFTPCVSDAIRAEKESFLSAVGLVTRDVLKELQNRRVERKRRSTANHTQFVYGSNWEVSAKKRKKSNYLTSMAKQHVTRQTARIPPCRSEPQYVAQKPNAAVSIFKAPLPVSSQSQGDIECNVNISQRAVVKSPAAGSSEEKDTDRLGLLEVSASSPYECNPGESCFVCHKPDANTIACSCSIHYHPVCAEKIENCVGCGVKMKTNIEDRRAEKRRLQEMNCRLNSEKEELETHAAELSVTLATQAEQKKNLLSMEAAVRRKIQCIHDFVTIMKNSHSVPSS